MAEKSTPKPKEETEDYVTLELNPGSGVDVLGDGSPPLLWVGMDRDFTPAEARDLLALRNSHGTPIVREIKGAKK